MKKNFFILGLLFCLLGVQNVYSQYYELSCKLLVNSSAHFKLIVAYVNGIGMANDGDSINIVLSNNTKAFRLYFYMQNTPSPFEVIIGVDEPEEGKLYCQPIMEGSTNNNGEDTIACAIFFSLKRYNPISDLPYTLCEKENIPIPVATEFYCSPSVKNEYRPKILISPTDESNNWQEISTNDFLFERFQNFVSQRFRGKSIYNNRFNVKIKFLTFESETFKLPPYLRNYPIEEANPHVVNNELYANLQQEDEISVNSYFAQVQNGSFNYSNFDTDGFLNYNFNGPYRLTFSRKDHCSVERYVFVPEIKYNKVNGSDNEFWYENEKRNAVTLEYKYPQDCTEELIFNHNTNVPKEITSKERNDGKIVVSGHKNNNELDTLDCNVSIFDFETDKNLNKIDVTITSDKKKQFVPVHINLKELKSYPNIAAVDNVVIEQPHCNYSDAILTFPELKGGLSNGYFYQINNEKPLQISDSKKIVLDDKFQSFTLKIFDNTENIDTIGRIARSLDLGKIDINRPQSIEFLDTVSTNLSCYHDNSGAFEIKDVQLTYPDKPVMYNWYKYPYNEIDKLTAKESFAKGLAAGNYIVEVENNGCKDTAYFTLSEPEFPLEISKDTVKNLVCFGYSNGRIITHTTGGTQPYTYSWNNGSQDTAIYNLKAGTYILSVTDSHGCKDTATQELVDPEELQNSLTPSHTICKNGELKIDEGDLKSEDLHYSWLLPNGTVHNERVLVVKSDMPEGNYVMISQDTSGCFTADTTNIKFSDNELNIKFLAPTYSYLGDTVVLAEDSEVYKNFSWSYVFNENMFTDITSSMSGAPYNHTFLESFKSGSDTITMYANDGRCNASYSKVVNILNEQRADYSDYNAPSAGIFTRLAIGPSYNDGNFTLFANLTEESELKMFILDLQRGIKIPLKYNSNYVSDHYAIPFHGLNLSEGVYALFVTANGDTKYVKFTVK